MSKPKCALGVVTGPGRDGAGCWASSAAGAPTSHAPAASGRMRRRTVSARIRGVVRVAGGTRRPRAQNRYSTRGAWRALGGGSACGPAGGAARRVLFPLPRAARRADPTSPAPDARVRPARPRPRRAGHARHVRSRRAAGRHRRRRARRRAIRRTPATAASRWRCAATSGSARRAAPAGGCASPPDRPGTASRRGPRTARPSCSRRTARGAPISGGCAWARAGRRARPSG
jgi:hypothetical protein